MKHPPQEHDIVPGWRIAAVGLGVVVATVAGTWIAYGIGHAETVSRVPRPEVNAMETSLFATEAPGLEAILRAEAVLSTYGWVDRDRQIVHVPIEVAIELYLARRR